MSLQLVQFRDLIIKPVIEDLGLYSKSALNLLLGTALVESGLRYIKQTKGPAISYFQIEPNTLNDCYKNYLDFLPRKELKDKVNSYLIPKFTREYNLLVNIAYSVAIARIIYLRAPEVTPPEADYLGLADYHKKHYNTSLGATNTNGSAGVFKLVTELN